VEEVKVLRRGTFLFVLLFSSFAFAAKRKTKAVYCIRSVNGAWTLQEFQPLINPKAGTVFTELSFAGKVLEAARLRWFYPDREVVFDYKYDREGRLTAVLGSVDMWGQWLGEADLTPGTSGTVENVQVKYYRAESRNLINRPDDAETYSAELGSAPIYRTIESLPCGDSLHEAEKMNATQE
jgi:hypothetical protein